MKGRLGMLLMGAVLLAGTNLLSDPQHSQSVLAQSPRDGEFGRQSLRARLRRLQKQRAFRSQDGAEPAADALSEPGRLGFVQVGDIETAAASQASTPRGAVDLVHSRIYILTGTARLGHAHAAVAELLAGQIVLGAEQGAGSLVIDLASCVADTSAARAYVGLAGDVRASSQEKATETLRSADVLDVGNFPTATFKIHSALPAVENRPDGSMQYRIVGDLTLHGTTRPLRVNAEAQTSNGQRRLRTLFTLRQTHFGIKPWSKALGAAGIADELKIWADIWLAPGLSTLTPVSESESP